MDGNDLHNRQGWELLGAHLDFFRLTVSNADDARLCSWTAPDEPGRKTQGFGRSEQRTSPHGPCWRKWEPVQASNAFGQKYASWEWDGEHARGTADAVRGIVETTPRVTRADVAFDLSVPDDVTPDQLIDEIEDPTRRGYTRLRDGHRREIGISGGGGVHTRYVGSRASPVRIRIYRKDIEDATWLHGPTLRIELQLTEEAAQAYGRKLLHLGESGALAGAAAIIEHVTGWRVADCEGEIPDLVPPEGSDIASSLLAVLKQAGPTLAMLIDAGLDVVALLREAAAQAGRMTQHRQKKRAETVHPIAAELQALLFACLRGETGEKKGRRVGTC
jgi:hypothetical protein